MIDLVVINNGIIVYYSYRTGYSLLALYFRMYWSIAYNQNTMRILYYLRNSGGPMVSSAKEISPID